MEVKEGKYTVERYSEEAHLARQSAINRLSKLKKLGLVEVSGGGKQKRIYTLHKLPKTRTNGFYDVVNRYSPEKLQPAFEHYTNGKYAVENAIIDGLKIGDARTQEATMYLFSHVRNWKELFFLARKSGLEKQLLELYKKAREKTKCRRIPRRYLK
jgi:hypothetical protein